MKKGRGRPKITLVGVIKKNMSIEEVIESMTSYRIEWRKRKQVADLTNKNTKFWFLSSSTSYSLISITKSVTVLIKQIT